MLAVVEDQDVSESGLMRSGGVVVLSGPALKTNLECVLVAIRASRTAGRSSHAYEALASEYIEAMSADGQTDVRSPAICEPVPMEQPTVSITEVARRLNISERQARRLASKLAGRKIGGSWFVTETALREHVEGAQ